MALKYKVKRQAQRFFARVGHYQRRFGHNKLLVLTYHRVIPRNDARLQTIQPGMVVMSDTFAMHIRALKRLFNLVHLCDWVHNVANGMPVLPNACAITFDDGWADNFHHAFPILAQEQTPATIFLVSDMIGTPLTFWPERLAHLVWNDGRGLTSDILEGSELDFLNGLGVAALIRNRIPSRDDIDEIIVKAKKYSDQELKHKLDRAEERLHLPPTKGHEILDWAQIEEMVQTGLVTLGSHTRSHCRLTASVDEVTAENEIRESKERLESKLGCSVDTFCYPDGQSTLLSEQLVKRHYAGACTIVHGRNSTSTDLYRLKRVGIHEDISADETAFAARLSGWI